MLFCEILIVSKGPYGHVLSYADYENSSQNPCLCYYRYKHDNDNKPNKMKSKFFTLLILTALIISCQNNPTPTNTKASPDVPTKTIKDKKAAEVVSKMMDAMGGTKEWEGLQYVSWTFFGARHLVWDKRNNRVRIESPRDSSVYLVNLNDTTGKYAYNGQELLDKEALSEKMKSGKSIWINDMYWLFMPFKLYDEGVSVKYMRTDTSLIGALSDILELRFDNVGDTPENKYEIYIDQKDNLVKQWDFYAQTNQDKPSKQWPWDNYTDFDGLLLSSDRSDNGGPSNVKIYEDLEDKVFTSFENFTFY